MERTFSTSEEPTPEERAASSFRMLEAACRDAGHFITGDGRVTDEAVAGLLGIAKDTLANWRAEGKGPRHYRIGIKGGRVTYRLDDLARWIESTRDDGPC